MIMAAQMKKAIIAIMVMASFSIFNRQFFYADDK